MEAFMSIHVPVNCTLKSVDFQTGPNGFDVLRHNVDEERRLYGFIVRIRRYSSSDTFLSY